MSVGRKREAIAVKGEVKRNETKRIELCTLRTCSGLEIIEESMIDKHEREDWRVSDGHT